MEEKKKCIGEGLFEHSPIMPASEEKATITEKKKKDCMGQSILEKKKPSNKMQTLCVLTLVRCPFHPRVTAVAP